MEQIVITVYNFYFKGFFTYQKVTHSMNSSIKFFSYRNEALFFHIPVLFHSYIRCVVSLQIQMSVQTIRVKTMEHVWI